MIYGSVCSGVEAASVAWKPLGWEAAWFCENDRFPSAVLKHHYPEVPNLHNMLKIEERSEYHERPIDLLVGGTPCQSFSIAGLRKGLADERGNLALKFCQILRDRQPSWFVWENVPGVLSSNEGRDFASILSGFSECGYGFAYRVLDAQYFGVAQRRRRVFVVGHLRDWRPAAAVLFEQSSLHGNPPPSRETQQSSARNSKEGIAHRMVALGEYKSDNLASTIKQRDYKDATDLISYSIQGGGETSKTANGSGWNEEVSFTLNRTDRHAVAFAVAPTLTASNDPSRSPQSTEITNQVAAVYQASMQVRRLTPIETERLQGFPDDYTRIPWRGKKAEDCPDGPRYKAMGNSMAVPCMAWIGERIQKVKNILKEI